MTQTKEPRGKIALSAKKAQSLALALRRQFSSVVARVIAGPAAFPSRSGGGTRYRNLLA